MLPVRAWETYRVLAANACSGAARPASWGALRIATPPPLCIMAEHPAGKSSIPGFTPPHPGSQQMPQWDGGELPLPPVFSWRHIAAFVGPGLVAGASAIGAGEWLNGPMTCAKYG